MRESREPWEVIDVAVLEADDVFANAFGERRCSEELLRRLGVISRSHDQAVISEGRSIEEDNGVHALVRRLVVVSLGERLGIDAELPHEGRCGAGVGTRALDGLRAARHEQAFAVDDELVALGVAAKVIVVVEEQHAGARTRFFAIGMGGREATDAGTDDDQVIGFAEVTHGA